MKNFLLVVLLVVSFTSSSACDACGCSINGDGWGIMPNNNRHFAGIRFNYRHYRNVHPSTSISSDAAMLTGDDHFYKADLFGRYAISRRLQVHATIPYRYNDRYEETEHLTESGPGDASLMLQFLPVIPGCADWKHAIQLNAGVEGPTGKFRFSHDLPSNMQTGSGTWDYLAGLNYTIRFRKTGLSIEGLYRINGHTEEGYDWGNAYSGSARLFLNLYIDSARTWIPWTGINGEYYESNIENMKYQIKAAYTGGFLLSWNTGVDYFGEITGFGIEAGLPLVNNLSDGYSTMKIHLGVRFMWFVNSQIKTKDQKHNSL